MDVQESMLADFVRKEEGHQLHAPFHVMEALSKGEGHTVGKTQKILCRSTHNNSEIVSKKSPNRWIKMLKKVV